MMRQERWISNRKGPSRRPPGLPDRGLPNPSTKPTKCLLEPGPIVLPPSGGNRMILLLGATGYVGRAFSAELERRQIPFTGLARAKLDYSRFEVLLDHLRRTTPELVINAAGYIGIPNVDACETAPAETLLGNTLLPQVVTHACAVVGIPWGHVSTGCI